MAAGTTDFPLLPILTPIQARIFKAITNGPLVLPAEIAEFSQPADPSGRTSFEPSRVREAAKQSGLKTLRSRRSGRATSK